MTLNAINRNCFIFLLLLFGLTVQSAVGATKVITQTQPADTCYKGNVDDVVELVNKAAVMMDADGIFPTFRQIMSPSGGFIKGELYVFVLNLKGTIVANGTAPESVGNNTLLSRDQNGHFFIQDMLQQAVSNGQGWIKYHWYSPCTLKLAEKVVFFKRAGGFVIGAGFYNNLGI